MVTLVATAIVIAAMPQPAAAATASLNLVTRRLNVMMTPGERLVLSCVGGAVNLTGTVTRVPCWGVHSILVSGTAAADLIDLSLINRAEFPNLEAGPAVRVNAGAGPDTIVGPRTKSIMRGEDDNDRITGAMAADMIYGGLGDDVLIGGSGPERDVLYGDGGIDTITGDEVAGLADDGNDLLVGGLGRDRLTLSYPDNAEAGRGIDADDVTIVARGNAGVASLVAGSAASVTIESVVAGTWSVRLNSADGVSSQIVTHTLSGGIEHQVSLGTPLRITLRLAAGNDVVTVKPSAVSIVEVIGGAGTDRLTVDVDTPADAVNTGTRVTAPGVKPTIYSAVETVTII